MSQPKVTTWADAPDLAIPENPALLSAEKLLWLAYETTQEPRGEVFAVVRFHDVIDHRLAPINDEGLGQHPIAKYGLRFYSFNEVTSSPEALKWSTLRARHWVVTFKDCTLDVLCASASVIARDLRAGSPFKALFQVVQGVAGVVQ